METPCRPQHMVPSLVMDGGTPWRPLPSRESRRLWGGPLRGPKGVHLGVQKRAIWGPDPFAFLFYARARAYTGCSTCSI